MKFALLFICGAILATSANGGQVFKADLNKGSLAAAFGGAKVTYGSENVKLGGGQMDVKFPAGSYVPSKSIVGGFGLYSNHKITKTAVFKYSVKFPSGFNFVKGGKLPGLYGGKQSCSGGNPAKDCFSTRLMWRADGEGEIYLYANREAQDPNICKRSDSHCNPTYGWSLNRGSFSFKRGQWTNVEERVTLNTPGKRNGILSVKINGVEVARHTNIVFRISEFPNMAIEGMQVETFFGGSTKDFATPNTQTIQFKDFVLDSE